MASAMNGAEMEVVLAVNYLFEDEEDQDLLDENSFLTALLCAADRRPHHRIKDYVSVVAKYSLDDFQDTFRYTYFHSHKNEHISCMQMQCLRI